MDATYTTKAIILRREPYHENDARVAIYTRDFGKLVLVARGARKLSSKLASHLEPLNVCDIMVVKGRQYDYVGSCVSEEVFFGLKNDYDTSLLGGNTAALVDYAIKGAEPDGRIFLMLEKFLTTLNAAAGKASFRRLQTLQSAFCLKFVSLLGYRPRLDDLRVGNITVSRSAAAAAVQTLAMKFSEVLELELADSVAREFTGAVSGYARYVFD